MGQELFQKRAQQNGNERRRFLKIARDLSQTIGSEFFQALVKELRRALGTDGVYIGEFIGGQPKRVRTLAACMEDDRMKVAEFPAAGTPDAEVALCNPSVYSKEVCKLFPADHWLCDARAEAWVGVALHNSEGQAC